MTIMRVLSRLMPKRMRMTGCHRRKRHDQLEVDVFSDLLEFMGPLPDGARHSQSLTLSPHAIFVTYAVERLNIIKIPVMRTDFPAQPLDVAVNCTIIQKDGLAIGSIHQLVSVLDHSWPRRQRLQNQEFCYRKFDLRAFPTAEMAIRVHQQFSLTDDVRALGLHPLIRSPTQDSTNPGQQEPL